MDLEFSAELWEWRGPAPYYSGRKIVLRPRCSHGMPTTQADTINADLLAFIRS